ncbi:hypothetical protein ACOTEG_11310 [Achromobacter xylosoxidans]|nr:hypothetical protein [Achromobacter xylosoxidans]
MLPASPMGRWWSKNSTDDFTRIFITKQTVLPCLIYIVKKQKAAKSRTVAAFQGDA